jgi:hypothetical protein
VPSTAITQETMWNHDQEYAMRVVKVVARFLSPMKQPYCVANKKKKRER